MAEFTRRRLGGSGLVVSELALGSWRTFERIPREQGTAVMRAAREAGLNFLDDARYNDETGAAPLRTGYSEVVFGELFRASGWRRSDVVIANKVWWEFWPKETAATELDASLGRMGLDHLDLVYSERPPAGLATEEVVDQIGGLIRVGKVRAWGMLNWPAQRIAEAAATASRIGVPGPCAAQLPYSLVQRSPVEDADMDRALSQAGAGVVASYSLAGGALSGKYVRPGATGRVTARLDGRDYSPALRAAEELALLAGRLQESPAALAIAFALLNPLVTSVLFGATAPEQITENMAAARLSRTLDASAAAALRAVGMPATQVDHRVE